MSRNVVLVWLGIFLFFVLIYILIKPSAGLKKSFVSQVENELKIQGPEGLQNLTLQEVSKLPDLIKKYITAVNAIGKPKVQNFYLEFDAEISENPGDSPLKATYTQMNFIKNPARFLHLKTRKYLVPIRELHVYSGQKASRVVRAGSLFDLVNISTQELAISETVSQLADICLYAPSALLEEKFSWKTIDKTSIQVELGQGGLRVKAILQFNEKGELISFFSEDCYELQKDKAMKKTHWSIQIKDYKEFEGRKVPVLGESYRHTPSGKMKSSSFKIKKIEWNKKNLTNSNQ